MTFSKLTWLKRTDGHKFTGAEFRVLVSLFNHSSADGTNAHPGIALLTEETGYKKAAISQALTSLMERGWITQTRKGSGNSGQTSVYALVPDAPSWSTGVDQPEPGGRSTGMDQPTEVGLLERTSWSATADSVGLLEWTPTDPNNRSEGSDHYLSDPLEEVRHPPNHLEDPFETASRAVAEVNETEPSPDGSDSSIDEIEGSREAAIAVPESTALSPDPWATPVLVVNGGDPFGLSELTTAAHSPECPRATGNLGAFYYGCKACDEELERRSQ